MIDVPDRLIDRPQLIHGRSAVKGLAAWRLAWRSWLPFVLTSSAPTTDPWQSLRCYAMWLAGNDRS